MNWLKKVLNTFFAVKMLQAKYKSLFPTDTKDIWKVDAYEIIDDWIPEKARMASIHGDSSPSDRTMKGLLKDETSQLVVIYRSGEPGLYLSLNSIIRSLKDTAKFGEDKKDLDDTKKLIIDIAGLPTI